MELRLPAPCLVVLIGASGSGKTTWADANFHQSEVVSSDRLRAMVGAGEDDRRAGTAAFAVLEMVVAERLSRKLTTVVDTLGFDSDSRQRWIKAAHDAGIPVYAVVFDVSRELARTRNSQRPRPIPRGVLDKQMSRFRSVQTELADDGFDRIISEQAVAVVPPGIAAAAAAGLGPARDTSHSFGLVINRFDWGDKETLAPTLVTVARRAEEAGFRDLWVMDHFRQIPRIGREWEDIPEAYTTLSFLSGSTTSIRLGALVTAVTHRHPVVLGKMVATLDVLSGGRANLGLGLGWHREEHNAYGIPFPQVPSRYDLLEDTLQMLPQLWGKGAPSFSGTTFSAPALSCYPRPVQDRIPILVGGSGEKRTLRLAARYADACNLFGGPEVVRHKVEVLRSHCADFDRDPEEVEVTHLVDAMTAVDRKTLRERIETLRGRNVTAEDYATRHNAGTVDDRISHIAAFREAGADHTIVALPDPHLEGSIEDFGQVIAAMRT